jgi:hypothetical protein
MDEPDIDRLLARGALSGRQRDLVLERVPPSDHDSRLHARFSWADKAFYVTAGACFLDPSFTA